MCEIHYSYKVNILIINNLLSFSEGIFLKIVINSKLGFIFAV
jgi:hypothetical protein